MNKLSCILCLWGALLAGATVHADTRVRLAAANLTTGDLQDWNGGEGTRILKAFAPDIVGIQELNYKKNSRRDIREFVDKTFGREFHYFRENRDEGIPNGIISRFPILEAGEWHSPYNHDRGFAWAKIEVPGDTPLWAFSIHLSGSALHKRSHQASELARKILDTVPRGDYVAILGDTNCDALDEPVYTIFNEILGPQTLPVDSRKQSGTSINRNRPYDIVSVNRVLRHVQMDVDVRAKGEPAVEGTTIFPEGFVFDPREFRGGRGFNGASAQDVNAEGMQHLLVLKDFLIPEVRVPVDEPSPDPKVLDWRNYPGIKESMEAPPRNRRRRARVDRWERAEAPRQPTDCRSSYKRIFGEGL